MSIHLKLLVNFIDCEDCDLPPACPGSNLSFLFQKTESRTSFFWEFIVAKFLLKLKWFSLSGKVCLEFAWFESDLELQWKLSKECFCRGISSNKLEPFDVICLNTKPTLGDL